MSRTAIIALVAREEISVASGIIATMAIAQTSRLRFRVWTFRQRKATCASRYSAIPPRVAVATSSLSGASTSPIVFFRPRAARMIPATIPKWISE